jgi:hypothetical protein
MPSNCIHVSKLTLIFFIGYSSLLQFPTPVAAVFEALASF